MRVLALCLACALGWPALAAAASRDDEATTTDVRRLHEDLGNLEEALKDLEPGEGTEAFRHRADEIHDEAVYIKVMMRRHQEAGREGTGVPAEDVRSLRRSIADLRDDIEQANGHDASEARVGEGTEIVVRLEESLSSRSARPEDRFEASVFRPVRADGLVAIPAGTRVRGVVRDAEPAHHASKAGRLDLSFDSIYFDRTRMDLRSSVVAVHDEEREHLNTKEKAGLGAVLGGVVGGIVGGKSGAIAGVVLGGSGAVVATKGGEVDLPAGTLVTIRLERPITVPREARPQRE